MYVRVVTFQLDGITPAQYEAHCEQIASVFLDWPGLIAKIWLRDPDTNTFGGVYLFDSKEAADRSRSTDVFVGMDSNPAFADVTVREYDTIESATAVTAPSLDSPALDDAVRARSELDHRRRAGARRMVLGRSVAR